MFFPQFFIALFVALLMWAFFAVFLRRPGPWPSGMFFLAVIFLCTWAGGIWIQPFGPVMGGVFVLPFFIVALLVALLIAAASAPRPQDKGKDSDEESEPPIAVIAISGFFWVLLFVLLASALVRYAAWQTVH